MISDLRVDGVHVAIATSKTEASARAIVERAGLDIAVVAGAVEGVEGKAAVVLRALRALDDLGVDTSRPVFVGDRVHDVRGAAEVGIESVGVAWGYAGPGELDAAAVVVHTPDALVHALRAGT